MKVLTAQSREFSAKDAVNAIKKVFDEQLEHIRAITFFASTAYEPSQLTAALNEAFNDIPVFGCSSAGEIIDGQMNENSIVAMAFTDEVIDDIKVEVIDGISQSFDIEPMVNNFEEYFKEPLYKMDFTKYFGITYIDGVSVKEEVVLEEFGDRTNVALVGGSAADDFTFQKTIVYANGKYYENGFLVALVKSKVPFSFHKISGYEITDKIVRVTKSDVDKRLIHEFDNRTAADVYCEMLNIKENEMANINDYFNRYPVGLVIDGEPYIRSILGFTPEGTIVAACSAQEGTKLNLLANEDIVSDTRTSFQKIKQEHPNMSAMLAFSCISRFRQLNTDGKVDDYAKLFGDVPTIGFNSYGEALIGHINQTLVVLVLE